MDTQTSSIFNFKRFCLKILFPLFLCITISGLLFQYFFEKAVILNSSTNGSYKVNRIINETNINEIPIFGSSRAEGSYIPSVLGPDYFNYGMAGTQDDVVLFFLKEECRKKKKTPILINFDMDGFSYSPGDIANYVYNSGYAPVKKLMGEEYSVIYQIPFLKYFGYYEYYLKMYLNNKINLTKKTDNGANLELNILTKKAFDELVQQRMTTADDFKNDAQLEAEFIQLIQKHPHRAFIFVISPYHKSCFTKFKNLSELHVFVDKMNALPNVRVIDFSRVDYPDSLYMNTTHLNYRGALRFSAELKDSLMQ